MLEKIKMLANIKDNTKDTLINFYIAEVTKQVLDFCNQDATNEALDSFILFKVTEIIKAQMSSTDDAGASNSAQTGQIQSIHRGDTTITYATKAAAETVTGSGYSSTIMLSAKEKKALTKHRKLKFI